MTKEKGEKRRYHIKKCFPVRPTGMHFINVRIISIYVRMTFFLLFIRMINLAMRAKILLHMSKNSTRGVINLTNTFVGIFCADMKESPVVVSLTVGVG